MFEEISASLENWFFFQSAVNFFSPCLSNSHFFEKSFIFGTNGIAAIKSKSTDKLLYEKDLCESRWNNLRQREKKWNAMFRDVTGQLQIMKHIFSFSSMAQPILSHRLVYFMMRHSIKCLDVHGKMSIRLGKWFYIRLRWRKKKRSLWIRFSLNFNFNV